VFGESAVRVGALVTVNVSAFEAEPPGFVTVTCAVPAAATSVAGMAAVSWVALTNVVVRVPPFHLTVAPLTKLVPVTVRVKAGLPAWALVGESAVMVGADVLVTVKASALEVPPPGLATVTCAVPAAATSVAGMAAVSWVALTNVVVRAAPFHFTVAPLTKLVPVTVRVKAGLPAWALFGDSAVMVGTGALPVTVNVNAFEASPSGFTTMICGVPAAATSVAGMAAVSWVALTNVVDRAAPFQLTVAPLTNLVPVTVRVKAGLPAWALFGDSAVMVGVLVTVNLSTFEAEPSGFVTVICAAPSVATSVAGMAAVSWVALTNVVDRAAPFHLTVAPLAKLVPVTVRVNAGLPAWALFGVSAVTVGEPGAEPPESMKTTSTQ